MQLAHLFLLSSHAALLVLGFLTLCLEVPGGDGAAASEGQVAACWHECSAYALQRRPSHDCMALHTPLVVQGSRGTANVPQISRQVCEVLCALTGLGNVYGQVAVALTPCASAWSWSTPQSL